MTFCFIWVNLDALFRSVVQSLSVQTIGIVDDRYSPYQHCMYYLVLYVFTGTKANYREHERQEKIQHPFEELLSCVEAKA